ncbi:MAG: hypothetical protein U9Q97_04070 [Acidobacteriota bacterium]|nr:hypothetical protein [Acidobacteriota bacterium]
MGCEFEKIDVWHVTLPGKPKRGYYNADISHIIDLLNECDYDKGYTIIKRRIKAVSYHNLPEFTGF